MASINNYSGPSTPLSLLTVDRTDEAQEKIERLARMLASERADGVIVSSRHNFAWLTAGGSNAIDTTRETGVGSLLVRADGRSFVLANRIEMQRLLTEEIPGGLFEPVEFGWEEEKESAGLVPARASELVNGQRLLCDISFGNCGNRVRVAESSIAACRFQLTAPEIDRYRALGRDMGETIGQVARNIEGGLTENEIAQRVDAAVAAKGARNVVTLVAADDRLMRFRHPLPTANRWRKLLMIVVCAQRRGLTVALTRIVSAGEVPDELKTRIAATANVHAQLLAATRPGVTGAQLYNVAARGYAGTGFVGEEHLHHQGGAIGYRIRDWIAHPASAESVRLNQAFAWNPSITGTKVEETCLSSAEGVDIVTSTPGWPTIAVNVDGRDYESPDVLSL